MDRLVRAWRRLRFLLRWRRFDAELDEEMRLHIELRTEALMRAGRSPRAARDEALRGFGNALRLREDGRAVWGWGWLEAVFQDARHAWRLLGADRLLAFTLIGILALGIGSTVLVFSLLDAIEWRALTYGDRSRLVVLETVRGPDRRFERASLAELTDWRLPAGRVMRLSGWRTRAMTIGGGETAEGVVGQSVSCDFFETLGVRLALGAGFKAADCAAGAEKVVVISDATWRRRLGGVPAAVGQRLVVNNESTRVVGVLPAGFRGFLDGAAARVWEPLRNDAALARSEHNVGVVGRLRDNVTLAQAREAMKLTARDPVASPDTAGYSIVVHDFTSVASAGLGPAAKVVMTAALLVLLVACANVAILLLARGLHRRHELTVRRVLGATRWRVIRQLLVEALVLGTLAGLAGTVAAAVAMKAVAALGQDLLAPLGIENLAVEPRALIFVLLTSIATGLGSGLLPALHGSDVALTGGKRLLRGAARVGRAKSLLIVSETAVSLVLLCAALLLLSSFTGVLQATRSPGYRVADVWSFVVAVPDLERGSDAARERFFQSVLERMRSLPGVSSCALVSRLPVAQRAPLVEYLAEASGASSAASGRAGYRLVSAGYFSALGLPILHGRAFTDADAGPAPAVAILTQTLAERMGGAGSVVGRRVRIAGTWRTTVGVVADTRATVPGERPPAEVLVPHAGQYADAVTVLVTRPGSSPGFGVEVGAALRQIVRGQHVPEVRPLGQVLGDSIRGVGFVVALTLAFAAVAFLVTLAGVGGVVAYAVARRAHEVGVRVALGATRRQVLSLVVRQTAIRMTVGTVSGLALALAATRVLPSRLFGVRPGSPLLFLAVTTAFMTIGLAAALLAARRAATVDPSVALRGE